MRTLRNSWQNRITSEQGAKAKESYGKTVKEIRAARLASLEELEAELQASAHREMITKIKGLIPFLR